MKKLRTISLFLVVMMLSTILASAASAATTSTIKVKTQPINLTFDGQALKLPDGQYAFIYQGRTYVPIRYISYALLKTVNWDSAKSKATISEPTEAQLVALKKQLQAAVSGNTKPQKSVEIKIQPIKASLEFDGKSAVLPAGQSLYGYGGSIYVPLRFLSESVGTQIGWDAVTKTVSGESAAYRAEHAGGGVTTPGTGGGTGGTGSGNGGSGTGNTEKIPYATITAETDAKLFALKDSCKAALWEIAKAYVAATDTAVQAQLKAKGLQEIDNCTAKFEVIIAAASAKLTANGHSTAIIAEYRASFQAEMDAGRELAGSLA